MPSPRKSSAPEFAHEDPELAGRSDRVRVLVFGATGTGKTSLCNVLTNRTRPTDSGARGITAKSHIYPAFRHGDTLIEVIDTVGLHESDYGTVPADQAVVALVELLERARNGFSLLIHVTRASRITRDHDDDYTFFVEKMTQGEIPTILAVTGCENEHPMESWIERNRDAFARFKYVDMVATCFAAGGPMESHFEPLRARSREALLVTIAKHALREPKRIYGAETGTTFSEALTRIWNDFVEIAGLPKKYRRKVNESAFDLLKRLGVPEKVAEIAIAHIPELLGELGNKLPLPGSGKVVKRIARFILEKLLRRPASPK